MANLNCFTSFGDDQHPVTDGISGSLQRKVDELFSLLWDVSFGGMTNLLLLHRNASRLEDEMTQLEELRDDLSSRASAEDAQPQTEIMHQLQGWLGRVEKLRSEVTQFQAALERQSMCITGLSLAYSAVDNLRRAQELARRGRSFSSVTSAAAPGADALDVEMDELVVMRNDLMRRVEVQEAVDPQVRRTNLVETWVKKVDVLLWSSGSSETSAVVIDTLRQVHNLKAQGSDLQGHDVVSRLPPDAVEEVPNVPGSSIVGGEEPLSEVRRHLMEAEVGIIGIYGMGGVGKTTLLRKLNNELLQPEGSNLFDLVAWVTVSRDPNILSVQYGISKRMGLSFSTEFSGPGATRRAHDQAKSLFKALSRKRFLLLLDDVWEKLDLEKIGIPHPVGRTSCKIAFTTRSVEVCTDMDADKKVAVRPLDETQSWKLFCQKVGANEVLNDPSTQPLAKEVVKKCGGLPLALITVGRAMAGREHRSEWNHAIQSLDDSATELRGMEFVLSTLKFSYDELENETLRRCLVYCALFPEYAEIPRNRLVEYWIGEGLLDDDTKNHDINRARNKGHFILSRLQDACLLEPREMMIWGEAVGLHDAVRDMALWLTNHKFFGKSNMFLALAGRCEVPPTEYWEDATRISLVENQTEVSSDAAPNCPSLSTLLLGSSRLGGSVVGGFFRFMPVLRVLTLSNTSIKEVPAEIGLLVQLRCLDLSFTRIRALPKELGSLIKLRQLFLMYTFELKRVPQEAITGLTSLQLLDMYESSYEWDGDTEERDQQHQPGGGYLLGVRDLEEMPQLRNLMITLFWDRNSIPRFTSSHVLLKSTTHLALRLTEGFDGAKPALVQLRHLFLADEDEDGHCHGGLRLGPGELPNLLNLILLGFNYSSINIQVVPGSELPLRSLQALRVDQCNLVEDLTWAGQLPSLRELEVHQCPSLVELLKDDVVERAESWGDYDMGSFPRLKSMILNGLQSLSCISRRPLLFPLLEELKVLGCPELKSLPLGPRSAPKIRRVTGEQEWWDGLAWDTREDGSSVGTRFLPCLAIEAYSSSTYDDELDSDEDEEEPDMDDLLDEAVLDSDEDEVEADELDSDEDEEEPDMDDLLDEAVLDSDEDEVEADMDELPDEDELNRMGDHSDEQDSDDPMDEDA